MQNGPELVVAMENAPGLKIHLYMFFLLTMVIFHDFCHVSVAGVHPGRRPRTEAVVQRTVHVDDGCLEAPLKPGTLDSESTVI